jgi:hypothetical protein
VNDPSGRLADTRRGRGPWGRGRLATALVAAACVGATTFALSVGNTSGTGSASGDLYDRYDAVALAKKIPNDQGGDPDCAGTKVTGKERAALAARRGPQRESQHGSQHGSQRGAGHDGMPAKCHMDMGGPKASDFVDIRQVRPNVRKPADGWNASTGTFRVKCGVNAEGRHNSDNVIVAPGVVNGAHHVHDYVGNDSTSGASTDESLAAAGTTCNGGDLSTYYWPVLRERGTVGPDANADGGGRDGNVGEVLTASSAEIVYRGNPRAKVTAMPRFLRIITGDAKAFTNGPANANAKWTCTGFEDRVTTKYPLCPRGSMVLRLADFQSCWDGKNTDSDNHRSHIVFQLPDNSGRCPKGTVAVPQLTIKLAYRVPPGRSFSLDGFPEQLHNPITDHNDFINVMPENLMAFAVDCINSGRNCSAGQFRGGNGNGGATSAASVVNCPSVAGMLRNVPAAARDEVARNLALLDRQVREANARLASSAGQGGPDFVRNAVLGPLRDKRVATLDRIGIAIRRTGAQAPKLGSLAACSAGYRA